MCRVHTHIPKPSFLLSSYLWLCCQKSLLISPSPPPLLVTAPSFYREQFFIVLQTDLFMSHLYFLVSCLCPSAIFIAMTILSPSRELKVLEDKFDIQPEMSQTFESLWMEIFICWKELFKSNAVLKFFLKFFSR